jgi:murein DD-endopeptidase MepM/ murein hydrolase activator NlpD
MHPAMLSPAAPKKSPPSDQERLSLVLSRVWLIIAGLLLLVPTPSLAEPYLRVSKNGVVFYYFNNRETTQLKQQVQNTSAARPQNRMAASVVLPKVLPASFTVPVCTESDATLDADSPQPDPGHGQLLPGTSVMAHVANLLEARENSGANKNFLLKLLTKLSFFDAPVLPDVCMTHQKNNPEFVVPDVWQRVPKYFQEPPPSSTVLAAPERTLNLPRYAYQPRLWGRVPPSLIGQQGLSYCFPVARPFTFRDTWGDPRSGGRLHRAVDIFAPEGTELYAITSGVVQALATGGAGGVMLFLRGSDGRGYGYMHLHSYAPGIVEGKAVKAGELLGYVGHTGTINCADHLHLQVYPDHNFSNECLVNSYDFLVQLCRGIGVSDFNQPKLAHRLTPEMQIKRNPEILVKKTKDKWIQVYQRPWSKTLGERRLELSIKGSPTSPSLVIRNF